MDQLYGQRAVPSSQRAAVGIPSSEGGPASSKRRTAAEQAVLTALVVSETTLRRHAS